MQGTKEVKIEPNQHQIQTEINEEDRTIAEKVGSWSQNKLVETEE